MSSSGKRAQPGASAAGRLERWRLECSKEPLGRTLGPPDFYPPKQGNREDVLDEVGMQHGWRQTADGIGVSEAREAELSLCGSTTLWEPPSIESYRTAIWKRLRSLQKAVRSSRVDNREMWNVPLTGDMLAKVPSSAPEQRATTAEARQRWMQDLAGSRPLWQLAESVPVWLPRRSLLQALFEHDVPMGRALWVIKIVYLNYIRPTGPAMASNVPYGAGGPPKGSRSVAFTQTLLEFVDKSLPDKHRVSADQSDATQMDTEGTCDGQSLIEWTNSDGKWQYAMQLTGWSHRDGILDVQMLLEWLKGHLQQISNEAPDAIGAALVQLLKLLAEDLTSNQELARQALDLSQELLQCEWLMIASGADDYAGQIRISLLEVIQQFIAGIPDLLCCASISVNPEALLDSGRSALPPAAGWIAEQGNRVNSSSGTVAIGACRNGSSIAMSLSSIKIRGDSLSLAVRPPVLEWDEAAAVEGLWSAMGCGDLEGALTKLPVSAQKPSDQAALEHALSVVANWACEIVVPEPANSSDKIYPTPKPGVNVPLITPHGACCSFACHIIEQLFREAGHSALQIALFKSIDKCAEQGADRQATGGASTSLFTARKAGLLLRLAEKHLFSPLAYIDRLLADGVFQGDGSAASKAAENHMAMMFQLHHGMHILDEQRMEDLGKSMDLQSRLTSVKPSIEPTAAARGLVAGQKAMYKTSRLMILRKMSRGESRNLHGTKAADISHDGAVTTKAHILAIQYAVALVLGFDVSVDLLPEKAKLWRKDTPTASVSQWDLVTVLHGLMPWQRRRIGAWLQDLLVFLRYNQEAEVIGAIQDCPIRPPLDISNSTWLMSAIMLLDCCDGHTSASNLLVGLLEDCCIWTAQECRSKATEETLQMPRPRFSLRQILTILRARQELLAADLLGLKIFQICVGWLLDDAVSPAKARDRAQDLINYSADLLARPKPQAGLSSWWSQQSESLGQQHWAVTMINRAKVGDQSTPSQIVRRKFESLQALPIPNFEQGMKIFSTLQGPEPAKSAKQIASLLLSWSETLQSAVCPAAAIAAAALVRSQALRYDSHTGEPKVFSSVAPNCGRLLCMYVLDELRRNQSENDDLSTSLLGAINWAISGSPHAFQGATEFLRCCIVHGQVLLSDALSCCALSSDLQPAWTVALLARPPGLQSAHAGASTAAESWCMLGLQVNLPAEVLHAGMISVLEPLVISTEDNPRDLEDAMKLLENVDIRRPILQDPWGLYMHMQDRKALYPSDFGRKRWCSLPTRLIALSIVDGRPPASTTSDAADDSGKRTSDIAELLDSITQHNFELRCLQIRLILDEQVFTEKLSTQSVTEALKTAERAYREAMQGRPSEADKQLANYILAGLARRPKLAPLFGNLCIRMGAGVAEHLLQQVDQILQDPASVRNPSQSQLLGRIPLVQVLRKRVEVSGVKVYGGASSAAPFALESALATLALALLNKSFSARQKEFADQLVRQLSRLGEILSSAEASAPRIANPPPQKIRRVNSSGSSWGRQLSLRSSEQDAAPGPAAAVHVAIWMRLQVLTPLLPLVYSDREPDPKKNLRDMLATSLVQLIRSPAVRQPPSSELRDGSTSAIAAAVAAAATAQESLCSRLLALLYGLLGGQWPTWLSRHSTEKLREVPPFSNIAQVQQLVAGARVQRQLSTRLNAALPSLPPPSVSLPFAGHPTLGSQGLGGVQASSGMTRQLSQSVNSLSVPPSNPDDGNILSPPVKLPPTAPSATSSAAPPALDPWQLIEMVSTSNPSASSGSRRPRACQWLAGAVRVPRQTLTYAVDTDAGMPS